MLKKSFDIVSCLLFLCIVFLAILLAGTKLFGYTPYAVLSGSMEPVYPVGSVVYVKEVYSEEIAVDDDITYVLNEDLTVVTHRVVEIDEENGYYYTQGIANDTRDVAPVIYENIVGKVFYNIHYLGYISNVVASPLGLFLMVMGVLMWMIISYTIELSNKENKSNVLTKR